MTHAAGAEADVSVVALCATQIRSLSHDVATDVDAVPIWTLTR